MPKPLDDICCARLPRALLAHLAPLRCTPEVKATVTPDHVWLRWPAGNDEVLAAIMPLDGVELFSLEGSHWHRPGERLPAFEVPQLGEGLSLERVLFPLPVEPEPPRTLPSDTITLSLVPDDRPRATSALLCPARVLAAWADYAPTADLEAVQGTRCGSSVLLLGSHLPLLPGGQRFWGQTVLIPLGFRPEPALAEDTLCSAFAVLPDELLLLAQDGVEVVPRDVFRPLERAAIRLMVREVPG
jgi:hypothetical protein